MLSTFEYPTSNRAGLTKENSSNSRDVDRVLGFNPSVFCWDSRKVVRQRRNPRESADLTSIQELLASVDQETHSGEKSSASRICWRLVHKKQPCACRYGIEEFVAPRNTHNCG